jgi:hypothetical protein
MERSKLPMRTKRNALIAIAMCASAPSFAQSGPHETIAGIWDNGLTATTPFGQPETGPGPIMGTAIRDEEIGWRGDYNSPILQPWAAEVMRQRVENDINGVFQAEPKESCNPLGVPHIMQLNGVIQVLPTDDVVVITYMWGMRARIIYLNQEHPEEIIPSYHGHSIGHWDADDLVVDTIGFNDKAPVDIYSTPHTDKMHVVERFSLRDGGETLHVDFTVEDPGAFTTPWSATASYAATALPYVEILCAENNRFPDGSEVQMPMDTTPDF